MKNLLPLQIELNEYIEAENSKAVDLRRAELKYGRDSYEYYSAKFAFDKARAMTRIAREKIARIDNISRFQKK